MIAENQTEQDSSFNLDDVPFIDDDIDSNYEFDQSPLINPLHSPVTPTTPAADNSKPQIFSDDLINSFVHSASYESLEQICVDSLISLDISVWHKIAAIFDLVLQAFKLIDVQKTDMHAKSQLMMKLKETASNYIHDKYCDWIFENGGWV